MKRKLRKQIEGNLSVLEEKALFLINIYGPEIRKKQWWESRDTAPSGIRIYVPHGGCHPRPKPSPRFYSNEDNWEYDSTEYLLMKEFLNKYLEYNTRDTRSVRDWYGL